MASRPVIEYLGILSYFSFISLWSYIGSQGLKVLAQKNDAQIIYKPIDLLRKIRDIPLVNFPKFYPAEPSLAHRVLLVAIEEDGYESDAVQEFARKGLETVWAKEGDIADPETIRRIADAAGLSGCRLLKRAESEDGLMAKEKALTEEDRIEMLEDVIKSGRDPISLPNVDEFTNYLPG